MKNRKRKNTIMVLLVLLLTVTIGYALIATTLKINGNATITKQTWNVYWGVPTVTEGSVSTTAPTRGADSGDPANTKLTWSATLNLPGDFYEFEVDAVNEGTIDAMITGITPTVSPALPTNPEYIKYSITYADGIEPVVNHLLAKNTTERYKVRVYYDETAATADTINNMTADTTYTFNLELTYGQATDEAIDIVNMPSCVGCIYTRDSGTVGSTFTGTSEKHYQAMITEDNKPFLGFKLDSDNEITNGYVCGFKDGVPFCLEGTPDSSSYESNATLLQSAQLWNNACTASTYSTVTQLNPGDDPNDYIANRTECIKDDMYAQIETSPEFEGSVSAMPNDYLVRIYKRIDVPDQQIETCDPTTGMCEITLSPGWTEFHACSYSGNAFGCYKNKVQGYI